LEANVPARPKPRRSLPEFLNVPWHLGDLGLFVLGWIGIQVAAVIALAIVGQSVPVVEQFVTGAQRGDIGPSFTLDLLDAVVGFGLVWAFLRKYKVGWSMAGWRKVDMWRMFKYLALVLVGFIAVVSVLLAVLAVLLHGFNANQAQTNDFTQGASAHPSIALVALVLLPPVLEETIFRGFIFPALAKRAGVVWGAILSSAIFGIAHFQANISVYTFVLGLVLCFMYLRLKSIVPGIFLHMLNNYLAFIALSSTK